MLTNTIEVILVKKLNIPFNYRPILKPYKQYIKFYNVEEPLYIKESQLTPILYNSNVSVLIKYKNRYYWCLQFEELYKSYRGTLQIQELQRNMFVKRSIIELNKIPPTLTFEFKNIIYKTNDVKRIIIKDANN